MPERSNHPYGILLDKECMRIYFAISKSEVNGTNKIEVEGLLETTANLGDKVNRSLSFWEIAPWNRAAGYEARRFVSKKIPSGISRFIGVGEQLFNYTIKVIMV